jgi:asparagine synthase (glutamine-hydrolysing)
MKIRDGKGKWILRKVLNQYIPNELIDRPKSGFGIPIGEWLRQPLREWAESLINPSRLDNEGYLKSDIVHQIWQEHLSGKYDWSARLWSILMFQSWLESQ